MVTSIELVLFPKALCFGCLRVAMKKPGQLVGVVYSDVWFLLLVVGVSFVSPGFVLWMFGSGGDREVD